MTRKQVGSGSKAGAKARKKPKLKKTTLKDLESSGSSKVRGGGTVLCTRILCLPTDKCPTDRLLCIKQ